MYSVNLHSTNAVVIFWRVLVFIRSWGFLLFIVLGGERDVNSFILWIIKPYNIKAYIITSSGYIFAVLTPVLNSYIPIHQVIWVWDKSDPIDAASLLFRPHQSTTFLTGSGRCFMNHHQSARLSTLYLWDHDPRGHMRLCQKLWAISQELAVS